MSILKRLYQFANRSRTTQQSKNSDSNSNQPSQELFHQLDNEAHDGNEDDRSPAHILADKLCPVCDRIKFGSMVYFQRSKTTKQCRGCQILSQIYDKLVTSIDSPAEIKKNRKGAIVFTDWKNAVLLVGKPGISNPWGLDQLPQYSRESTGSKENIEEIKRWTQQCEQSHSKCNDRNLSSLPDRILDLGSSLSIELLLIEPPKDLKAKYVALSYCWGRKTFLCTTQENIDAHKKGIKMKDLPKTFCDVIQLTKSLGYRYLWIDSFCIIQDSFEDWKDQALRMGQYYSHSHLTITAACGDGAYSGLFSSTDPENIESMQMFRTTHYPTSRQEFDLENWPLFSRGWTFQERLLSPRTLIFAKREMIWECVEKRTCQCEGIGPYYLNEVDKRVFHDVRLGTFKSVGIHKTGGEIERLWRRTVMQFSPLDFTEAEDKLAAIQGIADSMKAMRKSAEYLAGIWTDSAVMDLLWDRKTPGHNNENPDVMNRAPSWSWASLDAEIEYYQLYTADNPKVFCQFLGGKVKTVGKNTNGYVKLKCPILKLDNVDASDLAKSLAPNQYKLWFTMDRMHVGTGPCFVIRIAEFWGQHLLVLKLIDEETQTYRRIGSAQHGRTVDRISWPEDAIITIV